jgi:hypothetical protein
MEAKGMGEGEDFVASVKNERVRLRHSSSKAKRHRRLTEDRNPVGEKAVKKVTGVLRSNAKYAVEIWGELPTVTLRALKELTGRHLLSIAAGDLQLLNGRWYVTHSGLLRMARYSRCSAITTSIDKMASDPDNNRWVFRATVYKSPRSRGFVGYGDADPSNVSSLVHGAEMRVAETRAVNRALRKAYGIGLCSVEELGCAPRSNTSSSSDQRKASPSGNNGHLNGQPRLRDRLCLLIRQYKLDAGLVKAYAADYCGTATLRDARRDQVEAFINDLAERAAKDRDGLICQLNSYAKQPEVNS